MIRFAAFLSLTVICLGLSQSAISDDGPTKDVPELQVLSNYVGDWDVAITSKDSPFLKGKSSAKWILNGRFVQQTGSLKSEDGSAKLEITTLMTYDQTQKTYKMWLFVSNGAVSEATGTWDPKTRTMTSTQRNGDGDNTTKTVARFADGGVEHWSITATSPNGKVLSAIEGVNTRRKSP